MPIHQRPAVICQIIVTFFGLAGLSFAQGRPLENIASRQYQHEIRPLRLALDRWLHELKLQAFGRLNTVIHEVMHQVLDLPASDEAKVVAVSNIIEPRSRKHR